MRPLACGDAVEGRSSWLAAVACGGLVIASRRGADLEEAAPGVLEVQGAAVVLGGDLVVAESLGECVDVLGGRYHDGDLPEADGGGRAPAPRLPQLFMAMWWW